MTFFREVMALRRLASEFTEPWDVIDTTVYCQGVYLLTTRDARTALFIVRLQNTWLRLANAWLLTLKALRDRRLVDEAQERDK